MIFAKLPGTLCIGVSVNLLETAQTAQFWSVLLEGGLTT